MVRDVKHIEVGSNPDIPSMADAARENNDTWILEKDGRAIAALISIQDFRRLRHRFEPSREDTEAALNAAGGWKGLVADDIAEQLSKARHDAPPRKPVEW